MHPDTYQALEIIDASGDEFYNKNDLEELEKRLNSWFNRIKELKQINYVPAVGDKVILVEYENNEVNREAKVDNVDYDGECVFVSNINIPYCGTICKWVNFTDVYPA